MQFEITETMTAQVNSTNEAGNSVPLGTLSCSIRAGKRMSLSVDLSGNYHASLDDIYVGERLAEFLSAVWERCRVAGLPVPVEDGLPVPVEEELLVPAEEQA